MLLSELPTDETSDAREAATVAALTLDDILKPAGAKSDL